MLVLFNVSISLEFSYPRIKLRASDWSSADKANVEKSKRLSADKNSSYSQIIATTFEHVVDTGLKLTITSFLIRICCLFLLQRPLLACRNGPFKTYLMKYVPTLEVKYWPTFWCLESRAQTVLISMVS